MYGDTISWACRKQCWFALTSTEAIRLKKLCGKFEVNIHTGKTIVVGSDIRGLVDCGDIQLEYIYSEDNVVDEATSSSQD